MHWGHVVSSCVAHACPFADWAQGTFSFVFASESHKNCAYHLIQERFFWNKRQFGAHPQPSTAGKKFMNCEDSEAFTRLKPGSMMSLFLAQLPRRAKCCLTRGLRNKFPFCMLAKISGLNQNSLEWRRVFIFYGARKKDQNSGHHMGLGIICRLTIP